MAASKKERLDKLIAAQTALSRKDVHKLLSRGQISVNGVVVRNFDSRIDWETDLVTVEGQPLALQKYSYLMMNKPRGVVCATKDLALPTVLDFVPDELCRSGLFPAGRLDKETTGFVLLTNDGAFGHRILAPKSHLPKRYFVQLDKPVPCELVSAFAAGVKLPPEKQERRQMEKSPEGRDRSICLPAQLELLDDICTARVTLHQGMYHQVRRMFAVFGLEVVALHREQIGGLRLDPMLQPGQCRIITSEELTQLKMEE
ncbi:MAG: rRNA pseudouridine synthase [Anaerotruncus sp.]|nr:rRNA pseudouridine synthase [Anaerotruncus sp.]